MKILSFVFTLILCTALIVFAVFNLQNVSLTYSPLHEPLEIPLYIIALGFMALGYLLGAATVWLNSLSARWDSRKTRKEIQSLRKELEKRGHSESKDKPPDDLFPALPGK